MFVQDIGANKIAELLSPSILMTDAILEIIP